MAEAAPMNKTTVAKNSFILLIDLTCDYDYEDERWDNDIDMMMNDDLWEHIVRSLLLTRQGYLRI